LTKYEYNARIKTLQLHIDLLLSREVEGRALWNPATVVIRNGANSQKVIELLKMREGLYFLL